jgi:hypothetical protein
MIVPFMVGRCSAGSSYTEKQLAQAATHSKSTAQLSAASRAFHHQEHAPCECRETGEGEIA